jgi:hypothetical protein
MHEFYKLVVMTISALLSDCIKTEGLVALRANIAWIRLFPVRKIGAPSEGYFLRDLGVFL